MEKIEYKVNHCKNKGELEVWLNNFNYQFEVVAFGAESSGENMADGVFWIIIKLFVNKPKI